MKTSAGRLAEHGRDEAPSASTPGTVLGIPGTVSPRGLQLPGRLTFEEWESVGRTLQTIAGSALFWVGDWWRHGEAHFGEEAAQAVDGLGYAVRSVQVAAWVCDRFPPIRRLIEVPFNVHQALAGVEDEAQRYELLAAAAKERWTVQQSREKVRELKQPSGSPRALAIAHDATETSECSGVLALAEGEGRSVAAGELMLTLFAEKGLLIVQRRDRRTGMVLNRALFTDEAKALVQDFLDGEAR